MKETEAWNVITLFEEIFINIFNGLTSVLDICAVKNMLTVAIFKRITFLLHAVTDMPDCPHLEPW